MASRIGVSRSRVLGASCSARLWFSAFCIALMPTSIGYQDLASLIARERGVTTSWHMIASPLGTVQAATFSYTRPIGTAIPEPLGFQDVNFDPRTLDAYAWKIDEPLTVQHARQIEYPSVNRAQKGDRLPASNLTPASTAPATLPQLQPVSAPAASPVIARIAAGAAADRGAAAGQTRTSQNRTARGRKRRRAACRADGRSPRRFGGNGAGSRHER